MRTSIVAMVAGMFAVTYLSRALPLVALSRRQMPLWLKTWLAYVAPAVLAALAAQSILVSRGKLALGSENVYLIASVPTVIVAARTKSLLLPVVVGVGCVMILRALGVGA
ncbi:MAG: AzlD domain-containing protein [Betaproteobacteria bacterium]